MQSKGIRVIPSLSWGEPDTFLFAFDGIPKGSIVAVSTIGVRKEKDLFMQGYNYMLMKIKPDAIICYGKPFEEMKGNIIVVDYSATNNFHSNKNVTTDKINPNINFIKKTYGYIINEKGSGSAASGRSLNSFPKNVKQSYKEYSKTGWKGNYNGQTKGTKAGKIYQNDPPKLPSYDKQGNEINYREFDVNNKLPGQPRDTERFVVDDKGNVYYTNDHYNTFIKIIGG